MGAYSDKLPVHKKREILSSYGHGVKAKVEHGDGVALITGDTGSGKNLVTTIQLLTSDLYMYQYIFTGKSNLLPVSYFWVNERNVTKDRKIVLCEPTRIATSLLFDRIKSIGAVCGLLSDHFGKKMHKEDVHFKACNFGVTSAGMNSKPDVNT